MGCLECLEKDEEHEHDPLVLSKVGFGCWQFESKDKKGYWGKKFTQELADELVKAAADKDILYMDTAEAYGNGVSEEVLGKALKKLDKETRDKLVIGSKIVPNNCGDVRKECLAALKRLDIECIDLYMVHWPITANSLGHFATGKTSYGKSKKVKEEDVPSTEKAFKELKALQDEGKIKHIGVCNFGKKQLQEVLDLDLGITIACNQVCYNLLFRAIEFEVLPFCVEKGI